MNVNCIVTMGLVPEIKYLVSCILYLVSCKGYFSNLLSISTPNRHTDINVKYNV